VRRRRAASQVRSRLRVTPAVALVGPRQCGKTTLAKVIGGAYFDLEDEADRVRLDLSFPDIEASRRLTVLDEAQAWPEIFPRLRSAIDRDRKRTGRFLLLGSVAPGLMTKVSESLAGRLALVELTPLLFNEVPATSLAKLWLLGGFPDGGILTRRRHGGAAFSWHRDYLPLLAQRDLPGWGLPSKPGVTLRLMRMLAATHGQTWNASQIGQSLGLSYHTVTGYLDFLEGAFLIRRLPPFSANLGARLVKSPKVYWRDTGLLHALLGAPTQASLLDQPWVGASFEGFVVEQLLGIFEQRGLRPGAFHFRTSDQREIDLVLDLGTRLWAIEIKLTSSPRQADVEKLNRNADLIRADRRFLVSRTRSPASNGRTTSCDLPGLAAEIASL
jgi:predicted AAA+ superfamily ATPase